jgi:PAS domain S-box-containing protein
VVAEDNLDHQRVIAEVVRRLGHQVIVAGDGAEGLRVVREHRPALLIADVDMPRMTGLELCAAVRQHTPVVLITAYLLPQDPRLAGTGALGVIGKPFSVPALTEALRRHLAAVAERPEPGAMLDAVLESLDTGVVIFDAQGRLIIANRAMRERLGEDEPGAPLGAVGRRMDTRLADGSPLLEDRWPVSVALRGQSVDHVDMQARDPVGRLHFYTVNARPVRAGDGTVVAAVGAAHDVTARHRTRQYEECRNEVLKVLAIDPDGPDAPDRILAAIGATLGWPHLRLWLVDEVTDLLRPAAVHTGPGESLVPTPTSIARGQGLAGRCWDLAELVWVPDLRAPDSPLPKQVTETAYESGGAVPVRSGDRVIGALTFLTRSRQEADPALGMLLTVVGAVIGALLEHRRAELLALHLAAATDEYMALAGHELRTPLTSIGSYIDLIAELPGDTPLGEVRDLFEVVHRNSARLRVLIDKLLDVAALESGHLPLATGPVDLAAVVDDAVGATSSDRGVAVEVARRDEVTVPGDRDRLRQVVDALLSNAVKFSPSDETVTVSLADQGDRAELTVADTGVGIPAAEQAKLFRRLYRGGNARHTGVSGSGLGLALCRVVVERHGGSILLTSHESTGTKVVVRLPKEESPQ